MCDGGVGRERKRMMMRGAGRGESGDVCMNGAKPGAVRSFWGKGGAGVLVGWPINQSIIRPWVGAGGAGRKVLLSILILISNREM